jgi:hypothetical protein
MATLLAELHEDQATGRIAEIYAEIRVFSGVPYVSSLQRFLATMPGVLEWAWDAVRPALASGIIQETGWRLARDVRIAPAKPMPATPDRAAVRNIAENFVRVSPVNLMTGACLTRLLTGTEPSGAGFTETWAPPAMLPPMPGNADPAKLDLATRATLERFTTEVDGTPFIPALYRQLAHFPAVLAWLADELAPRFAAPETAAARAGFRSAAREAAPAIVARLPGLPQGPGPDHATAQRVLATIDRYAETSPEMTMFGQLILDAL